MSKKPDTAGKKNVKNPDTAGKKKSIFAKTPDTAAKISVRPTSREQKSVTPRVTILIYFLCKSGLGVKVQKWSKK